MTIIRIALLFISCPENAKISLKPKAESDIMRILRRGALTLLLVTTLVIAGGCAAGAEIPQASEKGEIKQVIEVNTEGLTLHYLRQSFWGENVLAAYLADQAQFEDNLINDFEQGLAQSDRPVSASDYSFSLDRANRSMTIQCDIHGAISKIDSNYRATFFWLLRPLDLDFIDDYFEESDKGLSWQGSVNGVPTTINIRLPTVDSLAYEAWEEDVGHCHAHAWWTEP
jgi:hypothetical protein